MKTAKEILHDKAMEYNDGFLAGQPKWIIEAMQEYADQFQERMVSKEEYEHAVNEIGQLQEQLKEAEREIRDLQRENNYK